MLRKLIVLAITTGLAKKAWHMYQEKNGGKALAAGCDATDAKPRKPRAPRTAKPRAEKPSA
jgi:hypothetical protein